VKCFKTNCTKDQYLNVYEKVTGNVYGYYHPSQKKVMVKGILDLMRVDQRI
jgi:hypothetical protein